MSLRSIPPIPSTLTSSQQLTAQSAIIALGNYCPCHGPRLVFYTIRSHDNPQFNCNPCPISYCHSNNLRAYTSTIQTKPVNQHGYCSHSNEEHHLYLRHLHDCIHRSLLNETVDPSTSIVFNMN